MVAALWPCAPPLQKASNEGGSVERVRMEKEKGSLNNVPVLSRRSAQLLDCAGPLVALAFDKLHDKVDCSVIPTIRDSLSNSPPDLRPCC
jgi:hypothetical protein